MFIYSPIKTADSYFLYKTFWRKGYTNLFTFRHDLQIAFRVYL